MIPKGGRLGVHIDFTKHQNIHYLWRRCNVLLYLNKGWKDEWNGHLELWDKPRKKGKPEPRTTHTIKKQT